MEEFIAGVDEEILVEMVRVAQKLGLKGANGVWKDFLNDHDKIFGSGISDPARRKTDDLVAFLKTFTQEDDLKVFEKVVRRRSDLKAMKQFVKDHPDKETPQQVEDIQVWVVNKYLIEDQDAIRLDNEIHISADILSWSHDDDKTLAGDRS